MLTHILMNNYLLARGFNDFFCGITWSFVLSGNGFFCYTQLCYKMLTNGLMNNYLLARGFIRLSEHLVFCAPQEIDSFIILTCDKMLTHGLMNIWWLGGGGIILWEHLVFFELQEIGYFVIPTCDKMS